MKHIKFIFLFVLTMQQFAYGQDSAAYVIQVAEQRSPLVQQRDGFYTSPALRPYYRIQNFSTLSADYSTKNTDVYIKQLGSGNKGLTVASESFSKKLNDLSLWGKAYYKNEKVTSISFNETSDYELLYPYVMADTVGGDLNAETYFFSGGLAKKIGSITYGINAGFRGSQSFRAIDPRPKNIVSEIDLILSASKVIATNYALDLAINGQKYNQNNSLTFASELGYPLVFHDAGLGLYNEILAGSKLQAYYKGFNYGGMLSLVPINRNGFLAQFNYHHQAFDKDLANIVSAVSRINQNLFQFTAGYTAQQENHQYLFKLKAAYRKRKGAEAKFGILDSGTSMVKIAEDLRYGHEQIELSADAWYGYKSWFLGINTQFIDDQEYYISPSRFANVQLLRFGLALQKQIKIKQSNLTAKLSGDQQLNLNHSFSWGSQQVNKGIYTMLNDNFAYKISKATILAASLNLDVPVNDKYNIFIKGQGQFFNYFNGNNAKAISVAMGFLF